MNHATTQQMQIAAATSHACDQYFKVHAERALAGKVSPAVTPGEISTSITRSQSHDRARNARAVRLQRKEEVAKIAGNLDIHFAVDRDYETEVELLGKDFKGGTINANEGLYTTTTLERDVVSPKGGRVMAYRLVCVAGKFFTEFAVATCRSDEAFDPLLGKEVALAKFFDADQRQRRVYTQRPPLSAFGRVPR